MAEPLRDAYLYDFATVPARHHTNDIGFRCAKTPSALKPTSGPRTMPAYTIACLRDGETRDWGFVQLHPGDNLAGLHFY